MMPTEAGADGEQASGRLWVIAWQVPAFDKVVADRVVVGLR